MHYSYCYLYENKTLLTSKTFNLVLNTLDYCGDSALIICQNALMASQLQRFCEQKCNRVLPNMFISKDWFFEQWFYKTEKSYQFILHHSAQTILSYQQRTAFSTQLLQSTPLLTDFIRFICLVYYQQLSWKQAASFFPKFKQDHLQECEQLGSQIYTYLKKEHHLNLKEFYQQKHDSPACFHHINQLFFIDTLPSMPWEKTLYTTLQNNFDITCIIPNSLTESTENWLNISNHQLTHEKYDENSENLPVFIADNNEEEHQWLMTFIAKQLDENASTPIHIIYPTKGSSLDQLKKTLLQQGLKWSFLNPYKHDHPPLFRTMLACLHFT